MRHDFLMILSIAVGLAGTVQAQNPGDDAADKSARLQALIKDLDSRDLKLRLDAVEALADLGPAASKAVPGLVTALQDRDEDLRLNAAIALGKIGKEAVTPVAKLLASADVDTRFYALSALGWIGPAAKDTTPLVLKALADKDEGVRYKAAFALAGVVPFGWFVSRHRFVCLFTTLLLFFLLVPGLENMSALVGPEARQVVEGLTFVVVLAAVYWSGSLSFRPKLGAWPTCAGTVAEQLPGQLESVWQ